MCETRRLGILSAFAVSIVLNRNQISSADVGLVSCDSLAH